MKYPIHMVFLITDITALPSGRSPSNTIGQKISGEEAINHIKGTLGIQIAFRKQSKQL